MPRCMSCSESVKSSELTVSFDQVICGTCRRKQLRLVEGTMVREKKLASVEVYEVTMDDGSTDHRIDIQGNISGLDVTLKATVDQIRKFFTEQRPTKLKSISQKHEEAPKPAN